MILHFTWVQESFFFNCLAKAVHSLARRRTGQCLSMRACVRAWLSCLTCDNDMIIGSDLFLCKSRTSAFLDCSFIGWLQIPFVSVFPITLCETQLSAEDRSFMIDLFNEVHTRNTYIPPGNSLLTRKISKKRPNWNDYEKNGVKPKRKIRYAALDNLIIIQAWDIVFSIYWHHHTLPNSVQWWVVLLLIQF